MADVAAEKFKVGSVVKYSRPANLSEAAARFDVVEDRGDRVLIRLQCDLPIRPTEVVPGEEITVIE